jgi:hypothetical protein
VTGITLIALRSRIDRRRCGFSVRAHRVIGAASVAAMTHSCGEMGTLRGAANHFRVVK